MAKTTSDKSSHACPEQLYRFRIPLPVILLFSLLHRSVVDKYHPPKLLHQEQKFHLYAGNLQDH
jgi:hypothetical protein